MLPHCFVTQIHACTLPYLPKLYQISPKYKQLPIANLSASEEFHCIRICLYNSSLLPFTEWFVSIMCAGCDYWCLCCVQLAILHRKDMTQSGSQKWTEDTSNGVTVHIIETNHSVQWEQAAVMKTEQYITRWTIYVPKQHNMNLDLGLEIEGV